MIKIVSLSDFVNNVIKDVETDPTHFISFANDQAKASNDVDDLTINKIKMRNFYRGHSDIKYQLIPSIARLNNDNESNFGFETNMITRALLKNPVELSSIKNRINLLARLQHYGLETRLLDVTENALIALYFACITNPDVDGEVICFKAESKSVYNSSQITPRLYSNFSKLQCKDYSSLVIIHHFISDPENSDLVSRVGMGDLKAELMMMLDEYIIEPIIVEHELQSEREVRQHAAFIIFPNEYDRENKTFKKEIRKIDENSHLVSNRFVIPSDKKSKLLSQLSLFGITNEYIFPEFNNRCKAINRNIRDYYAEDTIIKFNPNIRL